MRFPTLWYVRRAKAQISLRVSHTRRLIRAFVSRLTIQMTVKLLTEQHLVFLRLKKSLSLHLPKYHIVGNHVSRLK